jgi:FkbM family methyltransferase
MNIIQIGCNDCTDEAFKFITENEKIINKFMVMDALPKCVDSAKKAYLFLGDKLTALHCAVGTENKITDFYFPSTDEMCGHSSLSKEHLYRHEHPALKSLTVPVLDVNDIFRSFNDKVDWLFIDTEGFDAPILLHLDFEKYMPKNIHYEFAHTDGPFITGENHRNLIKKFEKFGYQLQQTSAQNIVAKKTL